MFDPAAVCSRVFGCLLQYNRLVIVFPAEMEQENRKNPVQF